MANQQNYVQVVPGNPQSVAISRIAESETDIDIIEGRLPAEFGFDFADNIEMHFYDSINRLVGSIMVPVSTGIISSRTIILPDNSKDEKIIINMTRVQKELGLIIAPGTYTTTLNFFSDEIGTYTTRNLSIEEVSPSRTELRLGFNVTTGTESSELYEFIQPGVPRVLAAGLVAATVGVSNGDIITQAETGEQQVFEFTRMVNEVLQQMNPDMLNQLINLEFDASDNLDTTIQFISAAIYDEFVVLLTDALTDRTQNRLQRDEIIILITKAIDNALVNNNINLFTQGTIRYI